MGQDCAMFSAHISNCIAIFEYYEIRRCISVYTIERSWSHTIIGWCSVLFQPSLVREFQWLYWVAKQIYPAFVLTCWPIISCSTHTIFMVLYLYWPEQIWIKQHGNLLTCHAGHCSCPLPNSNRLFQHTWRSLQFLILTFCRQWCQSTDQEGLLLSMMQLWRRSKTIWSQSWERWIPGWGGVIEWSQSQI